MTPRRTPTRLLAAAALFAVILTYVLMFPSRTEPDWWKHVGLKNETKSHHRPFGVKSLGIGVGIVKPSDAQLSGHAVSSGGGDGVVPAMKASGRSKDPRQLLASLVKGVDYFADYDVEKVTIPADTPLKPGAKRYFSYMSQNESKYSFVWMSNAPRIAFVPEFLTDEECDYMRNKASKSLQRSQVAVYANDKNGSPINDVRTSSQTWLSLEDPVVKRVSERIFDLTGFPTGSSEMMQILRYEETQKYNAHNDYFDPRLYGPQSSNRAVTVFLYLDETELGGETQFPNADGKSLTSDYTSCTRGLRVHPKKRAITVFYDMKPDGQLDPWSLHGGCPVKKGVKWGGTLWLRIPTGGY